MSADLPSRSPELPDDPVLLKQINRELLEINAKLQRKNESLQQQLDQLRRRLFGHKSEKLDPNQPLLFPELAAAAPLADFDPEGEDIGRSFAASMREILASPTSCRSR